MGTFKRTLLAGALALGLAAPAAAQYSNIYVLGDSLSDAGTYNGLRFTINPGLNWAMYLGSYYGFAVTPSNAGGTDYAQGGARVALPSSSIFPGFAQRPLTVQVDELLRKSPSLDPNALYTVWVGSNDVQQNLNDAAAGLVPLAQVQANLVTAGTQVVQQVARLQAAGARYIVVLNLPDLGITPRGLALGPTVPLTALASLVNTTTNAGFAQLGGNVININMFSFLREITANPGLYGFTNATTPACTVSVDAPCTAATLRVTPAVADTYVFADDIHPTPAGYKVVSQYVASVLAAPQQAAALAEAPIATEQAQFRSLDARMMSATNAPGRGQKAEVWATYDYGNPDIHTGFASGDQKLNTVSAGIDWKFTQRLLVGMAIGYTENKVDLTSSGFKLRETTATLYTGYGEGPWYVGATLGASDLDYRNVHRDITLGTATRTESGDTSGYATTARLLAGWWFNLGNLVHGPIARLTWDDVKVHQYSEQGSASTTMAFDQQQRRSLVSSIGWQAEANLGMFRPFARASWEHEFKNDERLVGASVYGMAGHFSLPAAQPDDNYGLFTLGAAADFGGVTGFIYGQATGGKSDGNSKGVTVGIRVPL